MLISCKLKYYVGTVKLEASGDFSVSNLSTHVLLKTYILPHTNLWNRPMETLTHVAGLRVERVGSWKSQV